MALVQTDVDGFIATVTLTDSGRRNAMSLAMADALVETFDSLGAREDVHAVVVTGQPPAFSAGADLADLESADADRLQRIYNGFLAVSRCPLPTVAAVNGAAVGAGLNLALACDVRIASESARFESRFLDLAIHPGGGHTWMLQRLVGSQAATAMVVLGHPVSGRDAARLGLALMCVEGSDLIPAAQELATRAADAPRDLIIELKRTLRDTAALSDHQQAVDIELVGQMASLKGPEFQTRLARLREKIATRRDSQSSGTGSR